MKTPAVLGGDPRIAGRRIGVYFLREQVWDRGLAPRTVANQFDLELVAVYRALAYSHDHPEELARVEHDRRTAERAARENGVPTIDELAVVDEDAGE